MTEDPKDIRIRLDDGELEAAWWGPPAECGAHPGAAARRAGLRGAVARLSRTGLPPPPAAACSPGRAWATDSSDPNPPPWPLDYMRREAATVLPRVLDAAGIGRARADRAFRRRLDRRAVRRPRDGCAHRRAGADRAAFLHRADRAGGHRAGARRLPGRRVPHQAGALPRRMWTTRSGAGTAPGSTRLSRPASTSRPTSRAPAPARAGGAGRGRSLRHGSAGRGGGAPGARAGRRC